MHERSDTHIGTRLRDVRKRRGLSQRELAAASGISLSLIRKLEQGEIRDTRLESAHRLARALRVPTSRLIQRDDVAVKPVAAPWRPLQEAIEHPAVQPEEEPSLAGALATLPALRAAYFANQLHDVSELLAPLLRDADALEGDTEARSLRAHILQIAGSVLTQARQFDAAETALTRALDASADRLRAASIMTTWTWLLVRQGRLEEARQMATRWADDMEPRVSRATPEDLAAWGWLLLQVSAASLRDNRKGEAEDAMRLARSVAVMTGHELPRGESRLATWGPVTVAYKKAERGIVLDRPDEVLKVADQLKETGQSTSTEFHRHRLDVARAHTMMRQYGEAVEVLSEVRTQAPEWLVEQRSARDVMGDVVEHRRTLTPDMRSLADAVGVPL
ncbi:helix-turn-helix domain-containing protein [Streptomyces sp. NBC_01795]|uniref:helix-turn-helix domain-containing protein n=1 Tax=unclassified Streptomyces TaxID=2593676 RepID=UPI002DDAB8A5|nr:MULTISPECIES: helix-turn-helix domain-containing protein [unclassified Streptomyces]WSA91862.1 helix-turn-helix domain-containing protein [Streptomyces sp. NBC_01795]WSS15494.1 helix-turn-helix domain-containing protein [Streptomyces sp. NBC_01186]